MEHMLNRLYFIIFFPTVEVSVVVCVRVPTKSYVAVTLKDT